MDVNTDLSTPKESWKAQASYDKPTAFIKKRPNLVITTPELLTASVTTRTTVK